MSSSLKKRLRRGAGGMLFLQAAQFAVRFAQIPILLVFWGADLLGEWLMLTAIQQYFALSEGGISRAAIREMVISVARGDVETARGCFQSAWLAGLALSMAMLLVVMSMVHYLPVDELLGVSLIPGEEAGLILALLALYIIVLMQTNLLHGGFVSEGRYGAGLAAKGCMHVADNAGVFVIAAAGGSPLAAAIGLVSTRLAGLLVLKFVLAKVSPWMRYGAGDSRWLYVKQLAKPSVGYLLMPASEALNIQGMRILVGLVFGPSMVVLFSALRTLAQMARMLLVSISQLGQNEIGIAFGAGDMGLVRNIHRRSLRLTFWAGLLIALFMLVFGKWIFDIWIGGRLEMDYTLFVYFVIAASVNALWMTSFMVQVGMNKPNAMAWALFLVNVLALAAAAAFSGIAGVHVAGFAVMMVDIVMLPIVIRQSLFLSSDSFSELRKSFRRLPLEDIKNLFSR